jgi:tetratricopeptide (TPR) repeat protein
MKRGVFRRVAAAGFGVVMLTAHAGASAIEADLLASEPVEENATLDPSSARKADAIARFAQGLFEEESEGPDHALESYLDSLRMDPANENLAIRVAHDFLRHGETADALSVLKDTHKALPDSVNVPVTMALIYLRHLDKPDLAARYAERAMEADRRNFAPYEVLWEIAAAGGKAGEAEAVLERAARVGSKDPEFWLALAETAGRGAARTGSTPDEETRARVGLALERALELGAGDAEVLARVGDLYALARQTDRATEAYERAYSAKSSLPALRQKLAAGYIELGRNEDAITILNEIVEINPLDLFAYDQLSALHLREGNLSKAAANARQGLIIEPGSLPRHELVVDLLLKLEDFDGAAAALAEARTLFPGHPKLAYIHGVALNLAGRHDESLAAFGEAAVEAANGLPGMLDGDFYFNYGVAAEQAGDFGKAAQMFKRSIERDPANAARSYNYLGYMWVDRNENLEEAGQLIRRAIEIEPTNGAYVDSLGWYYYRVGRFEEALSTLLRAADLLPEPDPVVMDHIADAYNSLGRTAEAVIYWRKALALDPENTDIAEKIDASTDQVVRQPPTNSAE